MRFTPHLLDEIRSRLPVSQVVARKVALKRKGREFAGLSPFKVEKTPSFFVNDQKGFYHCFASGEHGDIFKFVMLTEGLSFPEAVERLAAEAGVALPKPTVRDEEREDERERHYRLLEAAAALFESNLKSSAGAEARRYLERRGLDRDTIAAFRIGFSVNSRSALKDHLTGLGFSATDMAASGMLIAGDDIPVAYDRFRNRVMFPITDLKGRVIAFGGRALDADQPAKYLNSPETPLFHKGQLLFNAQRARAAAHSQSRVIAVEGYMDVIALTQAGIAEAVAPLGTALTEDQLKLLWRMASEPILCFDGDSAGRKAAFRAIDVVLPHLTPGNSVRFAFLPEGLDPDDLVRQQGPAAIEAVLSRARSLVEVLFEREWASGDWSTPERRAQLDRQLKALVVRISDAGVRAHYERDIRERLYRTWTAANGDQLGRGRTRPPHGAQGYSPGYLDRSRDRSGNRFQRPGKGEQRGLPSSSLKQSNLVTGEASAPSPREILLLGALLNHPWLIDDYAEQVAALLLLSPPLARLRDAVLAAHAFDNSLDRTTLRSQLSKADLGKVVDLIERSITHRSDKFVEPGTDRTEVEVGWRHALALHEQQVGLRKSLEAAERDWHEDSSEAALARIYEIQRQLAFANDAAGADAATEDH